MSLRVVGHFKNIDVVGTEQYDELIPCRDVSSSQSPRNKLL